MPFLQLVSCYKRLSHLRGTARHTMLVEVLSSAAQLYEKIPFEKMCNPRYHQLFRKRQGHWRDPFRSNLSCLRQYSSMTMCVPNLKCLVLPIPWLGLRI